MTDSSLTTIQVSVIMPILNAAGTLEDTLESLACQTWPHWELIAIDDGSDDSSVAIVRRWAETVSQPVVVESQPNGGPSAARNRGVEMSQAELVAFLDADDCWHPEKLRMQVEYLAQEPSLLASGCNYRIVFRSARREPQTVQFDWKPATVNKWLLLEGPGPALCSTLMIRRSAFASLRGFDCRLRNLEDVDLAERALLVGKIGYINESLCDYIVGDEQNHRDMRSVREAVEIVADRILLFESHVLRRRLFANLGLLEAKRAWDTDRYLTAIRLLILTWFHSPIHASRTLLRRATTA